MLALGSNRLVLGGSLKHAVMAALVEEALASGRVRPGGRVAELSAGASALALAQVGRDRGLQVRLYIPPDLPGQAQLQALGAELRPGPLAAALQQLQAEECWLRQNFSLEGARAVERQVPAALSAGHLVCCVGSGNTLRGFARVLRPERITAIYSADLPGLRPSGACLGEGDRGALAGLRADWPGLEVREVSAGELGPACRHMQELGLEGALSTAAVMHLLSGLEGAVGVSVDGRVSCGAIRSAHCALATDGRRES